jgi:hypothetical protein
MNPKGAWPIAAAAANGRLLGYALIHHYLHDHASLESFIIACFRRGAHGGWSENPVMGYVRLGEVSNH